MKPIDLFLVSGAILGAFSAVACSATLQAEEEAELGRVAQALVGGFNPRGNMLTGGSLCDPGTTHITGQVSAPQGKMPLNDEVVVVSNIVGWTPRTDVGFQLVPYLSSRGGNSTYPGEIHNVSVTFESQTNTVRYSFDATHVGCSSFSGAGYMLWWNHQIADERILTYAIDGSHRTLYVVPRPGVNLDQVDLHAVFDGAAHNVKMSPIEDVFQWRPGPFMEQVNDTSFFFTSLVNGVGDETETFHDSIYFSSAFRFGVVGLYPDGWAFQFSSMDKRTSQAFMRLSLNGASDVLINLPFYNEYPDARVFQSSTMNFKSGDKLSYFATFTYEGLRYDTKREEFTVP